MARLVARLVAQHMAPPFGQSVVIENRPGGGIGARAAEGAVQDVYTLLFTGKSYAVNETL